MACKNIFKIPLEYSQYCFCDLLPSLNWSNETLPETFFCHVHCFLGLYCEVLNTYFSSVFVEEKTPPPEIDEFVVDSYIEEPLITESAIRKKLAELNRTKSPGFDEIHPHVLAELSEVLTEPLHIIFSSTIAESELPEDWKEARVTALFKKGDKKKVENYRPVSLTCIACKVLESIIRDDIISHMTSNNLISDRQYGFVKGRSTSLQLLKVLEEWTQILDRGGGIDCIYCDFQKAFDKVPYRRLMAKIWSYGIRGKLYQWIETFLANRKQHVAVNGQKSSKNLVLSGVPQGSVLGPLLFVIFINDLPAAVENEAWMFADDTKIYQEVNCKEDGESLQNDFYRLEDWSKKWLLPFHPKKAKILKFGRAKKLEREYYAERGKLLPTSSDNTETDLGVTFDTDLKFEKHIVNKVNKANRLVGLIKRTFQLDVLKFRFLFRGIVRPHLEYATSVWNPTSVKLQSLIEKVQRRASKRVHELKDLSYEKRLKKLDMPTLAYRRLRGDMIEVFKMLTNNSGYDQSVTTNLLTREGHNRTRGHALKLKMNKSRTSLRKHFFTQRVVKEWNNLPREVIESVNTTTFKSRLDRCWEKRKFMLRPTQMTCSEVQ